jgi:hypothetical protein
MDGRTRSRQVQAPPWTRGRLEDDESPNRSPRGRTVGSRSVRAGCRLGWQGESGRTTWGGAWPVGAVVVVVAVACGAWTK